MEKKRNTIIIFLIILIALLISISYAFFTTEVSGISKLTKATALDKRLLFRNQDYGSGQRIIVTNNGDETLTYDLIWQYLYNDFVDKSESVYSITCTSTGSNCKTKEQTELEIGGKNIPIITDITIDPNEVQTFTMTTTQVNQFYERSLNNNCSIDGRIYITTSELNREYQYLEPKNLKNESGNNYLTYTILQNNPLITTAPDFNKVPVSAETYDTLPLEPQDNVAGKNDSVVEHGFYKVEGEDGYYTYAFRGIVNNYIKLGKYNGRIIRINEDGSIRVFVKLEQNSEEKEFLAGVWNSSRLESAYTYILNDERMYADIKYRLDNFYINYLFDYQHLFEYSTYCGDNSKTVISVETAEELEVLLLNQAGYTVNDLENEMTEYGYTFNPESYYDGDRRAYIIQLLYVISEMDPNEVPEEELLSGIFSFDGELVSPMLINQNSPTFTCPKNKKIVAKIGLPSAHEVLFSGFNSSFYNMDAEDIIWDAIIYTMTPASSTKMYMFLAGISTPIGISNGRIGNYDLTGEFFNPVINLKSDVKIIGGLGTSDSPYIVDLNS